MPLQELPSVKASHVDTIGHLYVAVQSPQERFRKPGCEKGTSERGQTFSPPLASLASSSFSSFFSQAILGACQAVDACRTPIGQYDPEGVSSGASRKCVFCKSSLKDFPEQCSTSHPPFKSIDILWGGPFQTPDAQLCLDVLLGVA